MTTIHAEKTKKWHFPLAKHHSLYQKNGGWLVSPEEMTTLEISDEKDAVNIDIHIPGITKEKVAVSGKDSQKKSVKIAPKEEIVHVIIPQKKRYRTKNEKFVFKPSASDETSCLSP